jgi:hypothetical protein
MQRADIFNLVELFAASALKHPRYTRNIDGEIMAASENPACIAVDCRKAARGGKLYFVTR